jgi:hypothetical protein
MKWERREHRGLTAAAARLDEAGELAPAYDRYGSDERNEATQPLSYLQRLLSFSKELGLQLASSPERLTPTYVRPRRPFQGSLQRSFGRCETALSAKIALLSSKLSDHAHQMDEGVGSALP